MFEADGGFVESLATDQRTVFRRHNDVYVMHNNVLESDAQEGAQGFARPGK